MCGKHEAAFLQQGNKQWENYKRCTHTHNLTLQSKILKGRIVYWVPYIHIRLVFGYFWRTWQQNLIEEDFKGRHKATVITTETMAGVWKDGLCLAHTPPPPRLWHRCTHCYSNASLTLQIWVKLSFEVVLLRVYSFRMLAHTSHLWNVWGKSARQTWHTVFWSVSVFGNQRLLRERWVGSGLFFPVCLQYGQADHHGVLNQNDYPRCSTVENMMLNDSILRIKYHAIKSSFTEILMGLNINRLITVSMYTHTHRAYSPIQTLTH